MALKHDAQGFLVGEPMEAGEIARHLGRIKIDTGRILAVLKRGAGSGRGQAAGVPGGRSAVEPRSRASEAGPSVARRAVADAARAAVSRTSVAVPFARERDALGRFVSSRRGDVSASKEPVAPAPIARQEPGRAAAVQSATGQAATAMTQAADEIKRSARNADAQRAADLARDRLRGSNGRFMGGDGESSGIGGAASGIVGGVGSAVAGSEQIDPLLGAAAEVRGAIGAVTDVVTPVGRVFGSAFGRGRDGDQVGWLRKMWRELRAMRKDDAAHARKTQGAIAGAGGGAGQGGGMFGLLAGLLPMLAPIGRIAAPLLAVLGPLGRIFAPLLSVLTPLGGVLGKLAGMLGLGGGGAAATAGKLATGVGGALKGALKRVPLIGPVVEAVSGWVEDQRIANDQTLTPEEKRQKRIENAGGTVGAMGGAAAGALAGAPLGPVGALAGAAIGGFAGSKLGKYVIGSVSKMFESGNRGTAAVSSGKGDAGGASYGTYQLASKTGTLQKYLDKSGYAAQFAGMSPGTPEFNARWKQLAATDPAFGQSQHDFIKATHYQPQMDRLAKSGIDLSGRGKAVQEAVWSTSVQFGGQTDLIRKALAGKDTASLSDAQIVAAIQDYKIANNDKLFRSSSDQTRAATLARANNEKAALLSIASAPVAPAAQAAAAAAVPVPVAPKPPAPPAVPAAAVVDPVAPARVDSPRAQAPQPQALPAQDVRDRGIAHIVTGGIGAGAGIAHR